MHIIIIVFAALLAAIMLCGCDETQKPPTIEEGEFPFHFIYELNGETYDIEDVVVCRWSGFDHSAWFTKPRTWDECLKSGTKRISILNDENVPSVIKPERINSRIEVYLDYGTGDYYMGENMSGRTRNKPKISYIEEYSESSNVTHIESTPLTDKQYEEYFGIKVVEFTFSKPIKNTFK
jgi:hypothetical protein